LDRDGESSFAVGNDRPDVSFAFKARRLGHVDCDGAVDATIAL